MSISSIIKNHKYITFLIIALNICLYLMCSSYSDSFEASGHVFDSSTKLPIFEATVILSCKIQRTISDEPRLRGNDYKLDKPEVAFQKTSTDKTGHFLLTLEISPDSSESWDLIIEKEGYKQYLKNFTTYFVTSIKDTIYLKK